MRGKRPEVHGGDVLEISIDILDFLKKGHEVKTRGSDTDTS